MNELFIFSVKNEFYKLYKNKPSELFYTYSRIYNLKKSDKEYGYNLFTQISDFFDKDKINKYLQERYNNKIMYSYYNNEHVINNLFINEISILTVKSSSIRIETNKDTPLFIDDLKDLDEHLLVCNFKTQDYYFINKKRVKI